MSIHVLLSTTLRDVVEGYQPAKGILVEPDVDAPSARDLAGRLGLPIGDIKLVMINGRHAALDDVLRDEDRVAYFPPVGGG